MLAFYAFPHDHRRKIRSTNPLERVNREIGRRTDVVGTFPNDRALLRLAASLVIEQNDEWLVGRRYLSAARWSRSSKSGSIALTKRRYRPSRRPEEPKPLPTISYTTSWDLTCACSKRPLLLGARLGEALCEPTSETPLGA